jgi:hypothetical protein
MGLVKERENCHPQDLSFLSVIPRVSNFIHPVARLSSAPLSLSLSLSRAETGSGPRPATASASVRRQRRTRDIPRAREAAHRATPKRPGGDGEGDVRATELVGNYRGTRGISAIHPGRLRDGRGFFNGRDLCRLHSRLLNKRAR